MTQNLRSKETQSRRIMWDAADKMNANTTDKGFPQKVVDTVKNKMILIANSQSQRTMAIWALS